MKMKFLGGGLFVLLVALIAISAITVTMTSANTNAQREVAMLHITRDEGAVTSQADVTMVAIMLTEKSAMATDEIAYTSDKKLVAMIMEDQPVNAATQQSEQSAVYKKSAVVMSEAIVLSSTCPALGVKSCAIGKTLAVVTLEQQFLTTHLNC